MSWQDFDADLTDWTPATAKEVRKFFALLALCCLPWLGAAWAIVRWVAR